MKKIFTKSKSVVIDDPEDVTNSDKYIKEFAQTIYYLVCSLSEVYEDSRALKLYKQALELGPLKIKKARKLATQTLTNT